MSKKFGHKNHQHDNYVPPYDAAILAEPISNAGFSEEVVTKLTNGKISLLVDIVKRTEKDMYKINTFNKKNLFEVKRVLQNKRINFRPEPIKEMPVVKESNEQDKKENNNRNSNDRIDRAPKPNNKQVIKMPLEAKPQDKNVKDNLQNRSTLQEKKGVINAQKNNAERNRPLANKNRQPIKQEIKEEKINPKQQNKRIWDADGLSEQHTKEEREKKRPSKPAVFVPRDIYVKINKNDKWGFANRNGKEVVPPIYDEVFVYKDELCCVELNNHFGFIDREGNEVIPIEYDCALSFSEGYACVYKNNKCGYINKNNEVVIAIQYDAGTPVIDGNCRVKKDGKWGELYMDNPNEIRWIN